MVLAEEGLGKALVLEEGDGGTDGLAELDMRVEADFNGDADETADARAETDADGDVDEDAEALGESDADDDVDGDAELHALDVAMAVGTPAHKHCPPARKFHTVCPGAQHTVRMNGMHSSRLVLNVATGELDVEGLGPLLLLGVLEGRGVPVSVENIVTAVAQGELENTVLGDAVTEDAGDALPLTVPAWR